MEDNRSYKYVMGLIEKGRIAQRVFEEKSQEEVDLAVKVIGKAVYDNAEMLAQMAVEESGMGNVPDKIAKNKSKPSIIWNNLKGKISNTNSPPERGSAGVSSA